MAVTHRLFNTSPNPVVYDSEGHLLDSGGWVDADPKGDVVVGLVDSGVLLDQGTTPKEERG